MEIKLVLGSNGSGKSLYAETLAVESGNERIYLATMVPQTQENYMRIEKHRIQRQDKGFVTIEAPWNIHQLEMDENAVVLLEDAANLLANGMFQHGADGSQALEEILCLAKKCRILIIVSISGLTDQGYDAETAYYIHELNWLNEQLSELSGAVYTMCEGIPVPGRCL